MNGHRVRNASGKWVEVMEDFEPIAPVFDTSLHWLNKQEWQVKYEETKDDKYLVDIGIIEAELGHFKKALSIFQKLAKKHPEDYKIVASLGTCYELNGQLDSAFKYIKKGIQLNPDSHYGSEYIHLKILRIKKKMLSDPTYLDDHDILKMSQQELSPDVYEEKALHLLHQLRERIPYSPVPDPVVADLLETLGDYYQKTSITDAYYAYVMAKEYAGNGAREIAEKVNTLKKTLKKYKLTPKRVGEFVRPIKEKKAFLVERKREQLETIRKQEEEKKRKREEEKREQEEELVYATIVKEKQEQELVKESVKKGNKNGFMKFLWIGIGGVISLLLVVKMFSMKSIKPN